MQIDLMELFWVRLPLAEPMVFADRPISELETVYVRLESGGVSGWGEVAPGNRSWLTSEWTEGVYRVIAGELFPLLAAGLRVENGEQLAELFAPIKGNRHAKAAIDMAWWDLFSRLKGEPLWKSLGGGADPMEVGLTFDRFSDRNRFFAELERAKNDRFHRISLKLRPGWDIEAFRAARDLSPWPMQIQVDLEGGLDREKHSEILYRIQDFMPTLIEQPFPPVDWVAHAMLQESLRSPIALDESISTDAEAQIAFDLGCCKFLSLKPGRLGGLTETKRVIETAKIAGIGCYGGMDLTSSVGYRHLLAATSLTERALPCDYVRFEEIFLEEPGVPILPGETVVAKETLNVETKSESFRQVSLWNEPGIGFEPNRGVIEKYSLGTLVQKSSPRG